MVIVLMCDVMRQISYFKSLLDTSNFFLHSSDSYGPLIFLSLFESSLLVYLPWYSSPFSLLTGFPNRLLLRMCLLLKLLQLAVTFVGQVATKLTLYSLVCVHTVYIYIYFVLTLVFQVGSLVSQVGDRGSPFYIFTAVNLCLSAICLMITVMSTMLQWAVVTGSKVPRVYSGKDEVEEPKQQLVVQRDSLIEVTTSTTASASPMHVSG